MTKVCRMKETLAISTVKNSVYAVKGSESGGVKQQKERPYTFAVQGLGLWSIGESNS